mgnify:CR=1 FL=1
MDTATCAICGKQKELCQTPRINKIKQPRMCKDCLLESFLSVNNEVNDIFWITQLHELEDTESLEALKKHAKTGEE